MSNRPFAVPLEQSAQGIVGSRTVFGGAVTGAECTKAVVTANVALNLLFCKFRN